MSQFGTQLPAPIALSFVTIAHAGSPEPARIQGSKQH